MSPKGKQKIDQKYNIEEANLHFLSWMLISQQFRWIRFSICIGKTLFFQKDKYLQLDILKGTGLFFLQYYIENK